MGDIKILSILFYLWKNNNEKVGERFGGEPESMWLGDSVRQTVSKALFGRSLFCWPKKGPRTPHHSQFPIPNSKIFLHVINYSEESIILKFVLFLSFCISSRNIKRIKDLLSVWKDGLIPIVGKTTQENYAEKNNLKRWG